MAWCVAQLLPGGEPTAQKLLSHLNVPNHQFMVSYQPRRKPPFMIPAFPGYLFVDLDLSTDLWKTVNTLGGISRLLGVSSGRPAALRPGEFEAIAEFLQHSHYVPAALPDVPIGATVEICAGPFSEMRATCVSAKNGILEILADIMGRKLPFQIQRSLVRVIDQAAA